MRRIEQMLRERIGLDSASIGSSLIQRTVRLRMKGRDLKQVEDYLEFLARHPVEWNDLVESVVVTETWFFRDREPFAAFNRLLLEEWLPANPVKPVRLLSLPCSSGEEPYSLVMSLLDAGLPPGKFQIDGIDLSQRALARARRGVFGRNSFRGGDLAFRDRYFQPTREGYTLNPSIRSQVRFSQGNLVSDDFKLGKGFYDFIFCRNLLIYFDRPTQQKALAKLGQMLAPSGVLFVGPAEQPLVLEHGFVSASIPMAFACRKAGPVTAANGSRHPQLPTPWFAVRPAPHAAAVRRSPPLPPGPAQPNLPEAAARPAHGLTDLEEARRLARAGRLAEAGALCEAHLRRSRGSAQAYFVLGLVREANGDVSALDCYRKALYLEPEHYEALVQMAALTEKIGDPARARTLKRRAQRVKLKH